MFPENESDFTLMIIVGFQHYSNQPINDIFA